MSELTVVEQARQEALRKRLEDGTLSPEEYLADVSHSGDKNGLYGQFRVMVHDKDGNLVSETVDHNVITDGGRTNQLSQWGGIGSPVSFTKLGVGSGSTAAAATDTVLQTELTGNANRKTCTGLAGGSVVIVNDTSIPPYRKRLDLEAVYGLADGNNGSNFRELGLFSSATFASGTMANRIVLPADIGKTASNTITIVVSIYH
jgi:hypothetical protein